MKPKKKGLALPLLLLLVFTIIAASFSGLMDISSLSPNTWTAEYYIYNADGFRLYTVGTPFILDGTSLTINPPKEKNGEWFNTILGTEFKDGESKLVMPGINAKLNIKIPRVFTILELEEKVYGSLDIDEIRKGANMSTDWRVQYIFSFTNNMLLADKVTGKKDYLLNDQNSQVQVTFNSQTDIVGGVAVIIGSGLFTGGQTVEYIKDHTWKPGINTIIIDLPTDQLGRRTVEVKPFAYVYDMRSGFTSEDTGLCYVIDRSGTDICVQQKQVNIPTQVRFGYDVMSALSKTEIGESELLYFGSADTDPDVKIVNPDELNMFERFILWIKSIFA